MSDQALLDENFKSVGEGTLDNKKRIALTKALEALEALLGKEEKRIRFEIFCNAAGQILLSPEISIPVHEVWLYRNKEALASVKRGIDEAGRGKLKDRGSFARFAKKKIGED